MRHSGRALDEQTLRRTRDAVLTGAPTQVAPRTFVAASWRRMAALGLDPGAGAEVPPLVSAELERRRTDSGLAPYVAQLTSTLAPVIDAGQLVVIADADGRVLWRAGSSGVRRLADHLGFVGGSAWTEGNVGTNAIGTALVLDEPVQIQGPEHYVESHTRWGCAAAPIKDPWSGRTLGVVDVSGPSRSMHPAELAMVEMAARLASLELLERRRASLDRLRARAAPLLAGITGDALAVDREGHLAAAIGSRAPERVVLPDGLGGGSVWLPTLGAATAEPLDGGWLLRLDAGEGAGASELVLDLAGAPTVRVTGPSGSWSRRLSMRHAELLLALIGSGAHGRSAGELAADLFDDPERAVTTRAEMSRLRRTLGSVLLSGPYRISPQVAARVGVPAERSAVLPGSSAPVVRRFVQRL